MILFQMYRSTEAPGEGGGFEWLDLSCCGIATRGGNCIIDLFAAR